MTDEWWMTKDHSQLWTDKVSGSLAVKDKWKSQQAQLASNLRSWNRPFPFLPLSLAKSAIYYKLAADTGYQVSFPAKYKIPQQWKRETSKRKKILIFALEDGLISVPDLLRICSWSRKLHYRICLGGNLWSKILGVNLDQSWGNLWSKILGKILINPEAICDPRFLGNSGPILW